MIDFSLIAPELFLASSGLLLLLLSVFCRARVFASTVVLSIVALLITAVWVGCGTGADETLHGMFAVGDFQRFLKIVILLACAFALVVSRQAFARDEEKKPEYPILLLFAALGMVLMVSANDLIGLYVAIELQNLPLYVLVSLRGGKACASEAGLKYFSLGALSSAILLFGLSYVYGITGTTSFDGIEAYIAQQNGLLSVGFGLGLMCVLAGLAFKTSAAPFHMWTPDVYEGAPTPVTALLSSAPKGASLGLLAVVLAVPFLDASDLWQPALIGLSVASMLLGAFVGLLQSNLKRLMAYSTILNVGTILIGLVVMADTSAARAGLQGVLVYLAVYVAASLGFLSCLSLLARGDEPVEKREDLAGLFHTQPHMAFALAVCLFSMAGVPPLAGFFGKYFVLLSAIKGGLVWLALVGVLTSVVAAAYYLRVVKVMFFDEAKGLPLVVISGRIPQVVVLVIPAALVGFVLYPAPFLERVWGAAEGLLGR